MVPMTASRMNFSALENRKPMAHEKQAKYKLIYGDQAAINSELQPAGTNWKPILMSAVPDPKAPGAVTFAVMLERTASEY